MAKAPAPKAPKKEAPPPPADDDGAKAGDEKAKEDDKKGAGGKKPIVMIAVAAFGALVLGIGGGVAITTVGGGSKPAAPAEAAPAEAHAAAPAEVHAEAPKAPERASGGGESAESGGHGGGGGGHGGGEEAASIIPVGPVNVAFKPFIVNLNDLGGRRMLKLTLSVDVDNQDIADEVNAKMPQFTDTILLLLSSIQSDDVSGLDGKQRLKNQMINRINQGLTKGKLRNLYFSELVVQ